MSAMSAISATSSDGGGSSSSSSSSSQPAFYKCILTLNSAARALPKLEPYQFIADYFKQTIVEMREFVKLLVVNEFYAWLGRVRVVCGDIGRELRAEMLRRVLRRVQQKKNQRDNELRAELLLKSPSTSSRRSTHGTDSPTTLVARILEIDSESTEAPMSVPSSEVMVARKGQRKRRLRRRRNRRSRHRQRSQSGNFSSSSDDSDSDADADVDSDDEDLDLKPSASAVHAQAVLSGSPAAGVSPSSGGRHRVVSMDAVFRRQMEESALRAAFKEAVEVSDTSPSAVRLEQPPSLAPHESDHDRPSERSSGSAVHFLWNTREGMLVRALQEANMDFLIVRRFGFVYSALGMDPATYYKCNRYTQLRGFMKRFHDMMQPADVSRMKNRSLVASATRSVSKVSDEQIKTVLNDTLARIIGFYAIEIYVAENTTLRTMFEVARQWESVMESLRDDVLLAFNLDCESNFYLKLKGLVILFSFTMDRMLGLDAGLLLDVLEDFKPKFKKMLLDSCKLSIRQSFGDDFAHFVIDDEDKLLKVLRYENFFPFEKPKGATVTLPVPSSFSAVVPAVCESIERFLMQFMHYSKHLQGFVEDLLKGVEEIMSHVADQFYHQIVGISAVKMVQVEKHLITHLNILHVMHSFEFLKKLYVEQVGDPRRSRSSSSSSVKAGEPRSRMRLQADDRSSVDAVTSNLYKAYVDPLRPVLAFSETKLKKSIESKMGFRTALFFIATRWTPTEEAEDPELVSAVTQQLLTYIVWLRSVPRDHVERLLSEIIKLFERAMLDSICDPATSPSLNEICILNLLRACNDVKSSMRDIAQQEGMVLSEEFWEGVLSNMIAIFEYIRDGEFAVDSFSEENSVEEIVGAFRRGPLAKGERARRLNDIFLKFRSEWLHLNPPYEPEPTQRKKGIFGKLFKKRGRRQ